MTSYKNPWYDDITVLVEEEAGPLRAQLATANKIIDGFQREMDRQAGVIRAQAEVIEAQDEYNAIEGLPHLFASAEDRHAAKMEAIRKLAAARGRLVEVERES